MASQFHHIRMLWWFHRIAMNSHREVISRIPWSLCLARFDRPSRLYAFAISFFWFSHCTLFFINPKMDRKAVDKQWQGPQLPLVEQEDSHKARKTNEIPIQNALWRLGLEQYIGIVTKTLGILTEQDLIGITSPEEIPAVLPFSARERLVAHAASVAGGVEKQRHDEVVTKTITLRRREGSERLPWGLFLGNQTLRLNACPVDEVNVIVRQAFHGILTHYQGCDAWTRSPGKSRQPPRRFDALTGPGIAQISPGNSK